MVYPARDVDHHATNSRTNTRGHKFSRTKHRIKRALQTIQCRKLKIRQFNKQK